LVWKLTVLLDNNLEKIRINSLNHRTQACMAAGRSESTSIVQRENLHLFYRVMFVAKVNDGHLPLAC
jgi:hypothetical protein